MADQNSSVSGLTAKAMADVSSLLVKIQPFCRERIWIGGSTARQVLSGVKKGSLADTDLLFFNSSETSRDYETDMEADLIARSGIKNLSLKNQARMGKIVDGVQYSSLYESVASFPDTSVALALCLHHNCNRTSVIFAPYGFKSLNRTRISPTSRFLKRHGQHAYYSWIDKKQYERRLSNWRISTQPDDQQVCQFHLSSQLLAHRA